MGRGVQCASTRPGQPCLHPAPHPACSPHPAHSSRPPITPRSPTRPPTPWSDQTTPPAALTRQAASSAACSPVPTSWVCTTNRRLPPAGPLPAAASTPVTRVWVASRAPPASASASSASMYLQARACLPGRGVGPAEALLGARHHTSGSSCSLAGCVEQRRVRVPCSQRAVHGRPRARSSSSGEQALQLAVQPACGCPGCRLRGTGGPPGSAGAAPGTALPLPTAAAGPARHSPAQMLAAP